MYFFNENKIGNRERVASSLISFIYHFFLTGKKLSDLIESNSIEFCLNHWIVFDTSFVFIQLDMSASNWKKKYPERVKKTFIFYSILMVVFFVILKAQIRGCISN